MKDIAKKKKLLIIVTILVVVAVAGSLILLNPIRSLIAIGSMNPLAMQEVMPGIYAINNGYVNLYIIRSDDRYIMFDAGADTDATVSALRDFGISINDIAAVMLTHTDNDHVSALTLLPSAEVYMSDSNRVFLESEVGRNRSKLFIDMDRAYSTIKDGEVITIAGTQIQCIYTPGHTDGSVCYLVNGKYLFTGDNLNLNNGDAVLFNSIFNMNGEEQEQSLRRLSTLNGVEALFTMHTGYTADFLTAFSKWAE